MGDKARGVLHTFTDAELFELVAAFSAAQKGGGSGGGGGNSDDRVSLSNEGHISKSDFLLHWRSSLDRSLPLPA